MDINLQDIKNAQKRLNKTQASKDPTLSFSGSSVLDNSADSVYNLNQNEIDKQDVIKDTMNNWDVNNATIGNQTYSNTPNGITDTKKESASGYLFNNIDKLKNKVEALRSVYTDNVINEINKLTQKGINSEEDETKLDQLSTALQYPNTSTLMAMQGIEEKPNKYLELNPEFGGKDNTKFQQWYNELLNSQEVKPINPNDKTKVGTVYFLYNPQTNQTKVGFAKGTTQERYFQDDLPSKGWQILQQVRTKDAYKLEQDFHKIARNNPNMINNTGNEYNQYGETSNITNSTLSSGSSEIYNGQMFKLPNGKDQEFKQDLINSQNMHIMQNNIKHYVEYTGYTTNLLKSVPSSFSTSLAHGLYTAGDFSRGILNDITSGFIGKNNPMYISKGKILNVLKQHWQYGNEFWGYSKKNLVEEHKDFQEALHQFANGNPILGVFSLSKTIKALPENFIASLPSMIELGVSGVTGLIGKALYATSIYHDTIEEYRKNNNYVNPSTDVKVGLAAGALLDTLWQSEALHYIIKNNSIFFADKGSGRVFGSLDDIKFVDPEKTYMTIKSVTRALLGNAIKYGIKGAIVEAPAEAYEQLYQDVGSKIYSDKYKDKSFVDLVKMSANDIAESAWQGALMGGVMHSAKPNIYIEPIQRYLNRDNEIINDEAITSIKDMSLFTRVDIINKTLPKVNKLSNDYNEVKKIFDTNSKPEFDTLYSMSKNNEIVQDAMINSFLHSVSDIGHMTHKDTPDVFEHLVNLVKMDTSNLSNNDKEQLLNLFKNDILNNDKISSKTKKTIKDKITYNILANLKENSENYLDRYNTLMNILHYARQSDLKEFQVNKATTDIDVPKDIQKDNLVFLTGSISKYKKNNLSINNVKKYGNKIMNTVKGNTYKFNPKYKIKTIESGITTLETLQKGLSKVSEKRAKIINKQINDIKIQLEALKKRDMLLATINPDLVVNKPEVSEPENKNNNIIEFTKIREHLNNNNEAIDTLNTIESLNNLSDNDKISTIIKTFNEIVNKDNITNKTDKYKLLKYLDNELKKTIDKLNTKQQDEVSFNELKNNIQKILHELPAEDRYYGSFLDEEDNNNINDKLYNALLHSIINELKNSDFIKTLLNSNNVEEYNNKIEKNINEVSNEVSNKGFKSKYKEYRSISKYDVQLGELLNKYNNEPDNNEIKNEIIKLLIDYNKFIVSRIDKFKNTKSINYTLANTLLKENYDIGTIFGKYKKEINNILSDNLMSNLIKNIKQLMYTKDNENVFETKVYKSNKLLGSINAMQSAEEITNLLKQYQNSKINTDTPNKTENNVKHKESNYNTSGSKNKVIRVTHNKIKYNNFLLMTKKKII